jgi:hypothetical protein
MILMKGLHLKNKQKKWVGDCRIEYDLGGKKKARS